MNAASTHVTCASLVSAELSSCRVSQQGQNRGDGEVAQHVETAVPKAISRLHTPVQHALSQKLVLLRGPAPRLAEVRVHPRPDTAMLCKQRGIFRILCMPSAKHSVIFEFKALTLGWLTCEIHTVPRSSFQVAVEYTFCRGACWCSQQASRPRPSELSLVTQVSVAAGQHMPPQWSADEPLGPAPPTHFA